MSADVRDLLADGVRGLLGTGLSGADLMSRALQEGIQDACVEYPSETVEVVFSDSGKNLPVGSPLLDLFVLAAIRSVAADGSLPDDPATTAFCYPVSHGTDAAITPTCGDLGSGVSGLLLAGAERADTVIAPVIAEGQVTLAAFDAPTSLTRIAGFDPSLQLSKVADLGRPRLVAPAAEGGVMWSGGLVAARRALGYELTAGAREMLDRTVEYATIRHQFGRPIGSFQAVRHQLADVLVATEAAALALEESWADSDLIQTSLAKAMAGAAHTEAARRCVQVHGAIGYTAEHDLHRYVRRGWVLDVLLGSTRQLDLALGERLVERAELDRFGHLVQ